MDVYFSLSGTFQQFVRYTSILTVAWALFLKTTLLQHCSVAWQHGLTKAQVKQLEAGADRKGGPRGHAPPNHG